MARRPRTALASAAASGHNRAMTEFAPQARAAEQALRALFPPTPLQRNDHLSARFGAEILLKREDLTPVRSYKIRGAFNAMRKVLATRPDQRLFVCASAGNHAQGVAFVCRHFGVRGVIFMPVTTPQQKNRQDPQLWRRECRDQACGRLLRSDTGRGAGPLRAGGRALPRPVR
jgi:Threonine dehydratase